MKLTREQMILGGVLAIGLGALAIDRLVLGSGETSPQTVDAATMPAVAVSAAEPASPVTSAATVSSSPQPTGPSIAEQLRAVESVRVEVLVDTRDGFTPSESWFGESVPETTAKVVDPIAQFLSQHTLSAVMNNRIAIVNGQAYEVGDQLVDFHLIAVQQDRAIFNYQGQTVDLLLHKPMPKQRR